MFAAAFPPSVSMGAPAACSTQKGLRTIAVPLLSAQPLHRQSRTLNACAGKVYDRCRSKNPPHHSAVASAFVSCIALLATSRRRLPSYHKGLYKVQRLSFEPFGGVYARDWALQKSQRRVGREYWLWIPAFLVALSITWQFSLSWTKGLIALNVISFLLQCYSPSWEEECVLTEDTLVNRGTCHRVVASAFLHASWYHLAVNMYTLWYIGRPVERFFGPGRFLFVYLGSAVCAALASVKAKQLSRSQMASVGASGAVFGLMAAMVVFRWRHGLPLQELWLTLAINLAFGLFSPQVDNAGHGGGLVAGGLIAYFWGPRFVWSLGGFLVRDAPLISWPFM